MTKKIVNPETGKKIKVGGTVYLKLKRQGKLPKSRKGPTPSAKSYNLGKRKRGNDGRMWEVVKYAKGRRWQAVSKKKKRTSKPTTRSPTHPFIDQNVNAQMMRTIDNLADYLSACKVNRLSAKFCRSIEGKKILAKLKNKENEIVDKLNEWSGKKLSYGRWMRLKKLLLYGKGISTIPKELSLLTNLRVLVLDENELTSLPQGVFDTLTNLQELVLSENMLPSLLEGVFNHLTNLRHLDLADNALTAMSEGVFNHLTNLRYLDLTGNALTALPKCVFNHLINLQELDLRNNALTALPEGVFNHLTNLRYLDLTDNPLKEEDIPKLEGVKIVF